MMLAYLMNFVHLKIENLVYEEIYTKVSVVVAYEVLQTVIRSNQQMLLKLNLICQNVFLW